MHHRQTHSEIRRTPHPPCGGPAIRSLSQFTTRHPIQLHNSHRRSRFWLCMTTRPDLVSLATRVPSLESIWTMRPVGDLRARLKVSRRSRCLGSVAFAGWRTTRSKQPLLWLLDRGLIQSTAAFPTVPIRATTVTLARPATSRRLPAPLHRTLRYRRLGGGRLKVNARLERKGPDWEIEHQLLAILGDHKLATCLSRRMSPPG
jgi:hypothetical protein